MLRSVRSATGSDVFAKDGRIGQLSDFYFDDLSWKVRYLVVDLGLWLAHRKVIVVPQAVVSAEWEQKSFHLDLWRDQVEKSPPIDAHPPVSRQQEAAVHAHFGWPGSWPSKDVFGVPPVPGIPAVSVGEMLRETREREREEHGEEVDPHLVSLGAVLELAVEAKDGAVGHLHDGLLEERGWALSTFVISMRDWLPARRVLVPVDTVARIDWKEKIVHLKLGRQAILDRPAA